jgi:hypothetical protein
MILSASISNSSSSPQLASATSIVAAPAAALCTPSVYYVDDRMFATSLFEVWNSLASKNISSSVASSGSLFF